MTATNGGSPVSGEETPFSFDASSLPFPPVEYPLASRRTRVEETPPSPLLQEINKNGIVR